MALPPGSPFGGNAPRWEPDDSVPPQMWSPADPFAYSRTIEQDSDDEYDDGRRFSNRQIAIVAAFIVVLLGGALLLFTSGGNEIGEPQDDAAAFAGIVPSVLGLTQEEAKAKIVDSGYQVGEISARVSTKYPVGTISRQAPPPGAPLAEGKEIDISISSSPLVATPSLVGLPKDEALLALADVGLSVGTISEDNSGKTAGTVIGQSVEPGVEIAPETRIDMTLSNGKVQVPAVTGLDPDEAQRILEQAGFQVSTSPKRQASRTLVVLSSDPAEGTYLALDSTVTIFIPDKVSSDGSAGPSPSTPTSAKCTYRALAPVTEKEAERQGLQIILVEQYKCDGAWAVVETSVRQSGKNVSQSFILNSASGSWKAVARQDACSTGSGAPRSLISSACERG